jgi:hypothetical protein
MRWSGAPKPYEPPEEGERCSYWRHGAAARQSNRAETSAGSADRKSDRADAKATDAQVTAGAAKATAETAATTQGASLDRLATKTNSIQAQVTDVAKSMPAPNQPTPPTP